MSISIENYRAVRQATPVRIKVHILQRLFLARFEGRRYFLYDREAKEKEKNT